MTEPKTNHVGIDGKTVKPPKRIYLQTGCCDDPECECRTDPDVDGATWCADRIHYNDTEYVRADLLTAAQTCHEEALTQRNDARAALAAAEAERDRLQGILNGDASVSGLLLEGRDTVIGVTHPVAHVLADALAKMVDGHNYVEMTFKHKDTGDEYLLHCQRLARPTPHELRLRAESRAAEAEKDAIERCAKVCDEHAYEYEASRQACVPAEPKRAAIYMNQASTARVIAESVRALSPPKGDDYDSGCGHGHR